MSQPHAGELFVTTWSLVIEPYSQNSRKASRNLQRGSIVMYVGESNDSGICGSMYMDTRSFNLFVLPHTWLQQFGEHCVKKMYETTDAYW
jgi:hypothetical protein